MFIHYNSNVQTVYSATSDGVFTLPDTDTDFTFTDTGTDMDTMAFKPNCIVVGLGVGVCVGQCEHTIRGPWVRPQMFMTEFFLEVMAKCYVAGPSCNVGAPTGNPGSASDSGGHHSHFVLIV